jgi:hypothetical protein
MKHLLNGMPEWEKNSIREQYEGRMSIDTSKFRKLIESKLGNVKPLITEALAANAGEIQKFLQVNQDNTLVADYKFGNLSAIAAGKYLFRGTNIAAYNTVTNVKTLWSAMSEKGLDVGTTPGFGPKMAKALATALEASKTAIDSAAQTKTVTPVAPVAAPVKPVVASLAYNPLPNYYGGKFDVNAPADSTSVYKNNLLIDPFKKPSTPTYNNQFTFSQKK